MEKITFNYRSFFEPTLSEEEIEQLFESYKKDSEITVLLNEAQVGVGSSPTRNREVLEALVTRLFRQAMSWKTQLISFDSTKRFNEKELSAQLLRKLWTSTNFLSLSPFRADFSLL